MISAVTSPITGRPGRQGRSRSRSDRCGLVLPGRLGDRHVALLTDEGPYQVVLLRGTRDGIPRLATAAAPVTPSPVSAAFSGGPFPPQPLCLRSVGASPVSGLLSLPQTQSLGSSLEKPRSGTGPQPRGGEAFVMSSGVTSITL